MIRAENEAVFETLKARYREGIPTRPIADEERDTAVVYEYLARIGGERLVGPATSMEPGTFWAALKNGSWLNCQQPPPYILRRENAPRSHSAG